MAGELSFMVKNEMLSTCTFYRNLEHPVMPGPIPLYWLRTHRRPLFTMVFMFVNRLGKDTSVPNPDLKASCKIDIKKLARFMFCQQVNPQNVILCSPPSAILSRSK